jgi:hypothetical protein
MITLTGRVGYFSSLAEASGGEKTSIKETKNKANVQRTNL